MTLNADAILTRQFDIVRESYGSSRTILYALGVGADETELDLVYEKRLRAIPTMALVLAGDKPWLASPELGVTLTHVLHGEQRLEILRPLPPFGTVTAQTSIDGIFDRGEKGALIVVKRELRDAVDEKLVAISRATVFARKDGGFGGSGEGAPKPAKIPSGASERVDVVATCPDQAVIYRLSGDLNPLHIDPDVAGMAGFERPILHGLCTYGFAARSIINSFCDGDPDRLSRFDARFTSPVYPGEALTIESWSDGDGAAFFRVSVSGRDVVVMDNGRAEWRAEQA